MARDGEHAEPDEDAIQFGAGATGRRMLWGAVVVLVAVLGVLGIRELTGPGAAPTPPEAARSVPPASSPAPDPTAAPATSAAPTPTGTQPAGTPTTVAVDLSWLRASPGWELFGYSRRHGAVLRIEPARGTVTRTPVPSLSSGGPVHFVVRRAAAFVHPIDYVPGYVVPDGHPARRSKGRIPDGGTLLPGPEPKQLWVEQGAAGSRTYRLVPYRLVTVPSAQSGIIVDPPASMTGLARPDGDGYLLMRGTGGVYRLGRGEPQRLTTGDVVAIGPTAWVALECGPRAQCHLEVVNRSDGDRQRLSGVRDPIAVQAGRTSPDGSKVALAVRVDEEEHAMVVIDVASGTTTRHDVRLGSYGWSSFRRKAMAWSPDSRWLFVAESHGITAIDTRTGREHRLRLDIDSVLQLVVRPG